MAAPEPFFASSGFAEIMKAAGLGDMDMDAFRMLEDARQLVEEGEMDADEYEELSRGVQLQLLQLATGGGANRKIDVVTPLRSNAGTTNKIEIPQGEKPIVESILLKLPVVVSGGKAPEDFSSKATNLLKGIGGSSKKFEKKYCVLYKSCIIYFDKKGDKLAKGRIDLNQDFFVQDSKEHPHGFVLSDMNVTATFGAETEELKSYWIHMCAMVLRKLGEPEKVITIESDPLKIKFQSKLANFKKEKPASRRQSMFFRKKQQKEEEEQDRRAQLLAAKELAQDLRAQELQRQQELEKLQQELNLAQEEKNKFKTAAELEHERAEKEAARAREEENRRAEAESRLAKTLEDLRADSLMREAALLEEKEEITKKLQMSDTKKQSIMPSNGGSASNADFAAWEKERKALQAKLNALMDALNVDLGDLEWDGTLEDAEEKMKELVPALCSEDEKEARAAQVKFDQYDKVIRNHADFKVREENKWVKWENDNLPKNQRALEEMKKIVPHEVMSGISEEFLLNQCHLTLPVAKRVMTTKIYAFYYMDSDVISKLHIADLSSRYVCQGLDIRELRAVYCCLPKEFQLDPDGRKKLWRDDCRTKLKSLTDKEDNNKLSKNEMMHPAFRPKEEKPALGGGGGGGGARPMNPMAGALAGMLGAKKPPLAAAASAAEPESGGPPSLANMFANRKPPPAAALAAAEDGPPPNRPNLAAMLANRGPPPAAAAATESSTESKLDTSALQNALASKLGGRERTKSIVPSSVEGMLDLLKQPIPSAARPVSSGVPAAAAAAPTPRPMSTSNAKPPAAASNPPPPVAMASPKKSLLPEKKPLDLGFKFNEPAAAAAPVERKPPIDLGVKFNAPGSLLGADAQAMFNKAKKGSTIEVNVGEVAAYDFEGATSNRRKTWVDDGITKLILLIDEHGAFDKQEGGKKTATFGVLFEKFGPGSDMLVGILMRSRKKGKVKYVGDMLFKGVHDNVKITYL